MMTELASNTALNASQPVLNAENMRLDVELWSLLSYRLSLISIVYPLNKLFLNDAVVHHTPESETQMDVNPLIAPMGNKHQTL
ncbi:hypothetical protein AAAA28_00415 [Providencia stuartii]|uniref:hypothetical protein n=1 Tax=Providencia stuartii TaxID=588 RepID=UPI0030F0784F